MSAHTIKPKDPELSTMGHMCVLQHTRRHGYTTQNENFIFIIVRLILFMYIFRLIVQMGS
ncbi:hypothetical protein ACJX0J_040950 [Zea mays]